MGDAGLRLAHVSLHDDTMNVARIIDPFPADA